MDVRCPSCSTGYELASIELPEGGANLQCAHCGFTFLVRPPPEPPDWFLRRHGQTTTLPVGDLATLVRLARDGRIDRRDALSRDAETWLAIDQLPELVPLLPVPPADNPTSRREATAPERAPTPVPPAASAPSPHPPGAARRSAPTSDPDPSDGAFADEPPARRDTGGPRLLLVAVALTIVALGATLWVLRSGRQADPGTSEQGVATAHHADATDGAESMAPDAAARAERDEPPTDAQPGATAKPAGDAARASRIPEPPPVREASPRPTGTGGGDPLRRAEAALARGDLSAAMELFEAAVDRDPTSLSGHVGIATIHEQRGRADLAEARYRRALAVNPRYLPALFGLAEAQRAQGEDAEAIEAYRLIIRTAATSRWAERSRARLEKMGVAAP